MCGKLTTFTVNRQDLNTVRAIAAKEAERFTGINKPQIIPAQNKRPPVLSGSLKVMNDTIN